MRRFYNGLLWLTLILGSELANASEAITISVFEDHERYVLASDSYGLSWQILEAAAKRSGIQLQTQESSWRASMNRIQAHRVDMVFAALKTEERSQWANFTVPLIAEGSGIFTRPDNPVTTFEQIDLKNSVIGVSLNSLQETIARDLGFENIYSTVQRPQLYDMLNRNRVDYLFFGKSIIRYYCVYFDESRNPECMKQVGELYYPNNVHALVHKENEKANKVLAELNKNIIAFSGSKETKKLFESYDFPHEIYDAWLLMLNSAK